MANWVQRFLTAIATHKADANAHHDKVHGATEHNNVTRELFLPALEGYILEGVSDVHGLYAEAMGEPNLYEPIVMFSFKVPDDFVSFISLKGIWESPAAAGNMYWDMGANYAAAGEHFTTHEEYPAMAVTATSGLSIINVQEPANPLTLALLTKDDYLGITWERDGANPLDTLENYVYFYGLLFTYEAEQ